MKIGKQSWKSCKLFDVLYVPELAYNLLSVPKATETEIKKTITFDDKGCRILNSSQTRNQSRKFVLLDYLKSPHVNTVKEEKIKLWHHQFGHLGA